jgi:hypothetical protein
MICKVDSYKDCLVRNIRFDKLLNSHNNLQSIRALVNLYACSIKVLNLSAALFYCLHICRIFTAQIYYFLGNINLGRYKMASEQISSIDPRCQLLSSKKI